MRVAIAAALLLLLIAACSSNPTESDCKCFNLQVTVLDTLSQPVQGLQVSMWNMLTGVSPVRTGAESPTPASIPPPTSFALDQNYPNPFNGQTEIRMTMVAFGDFTLDFLDLTGRSVDQVQVDSAVAGYHVTTWTPPMATSAVYLYRVSAYLSDTLQFTDSAYAVCWYPDAASNVVGTTDLSGVMTSRDSLRFPSLFDLPDMVQTDAVSSDTVGLFRVSDSILVVLTDIGSARSQEYRRAVGKGAHSYVLRWNPGP
jgi:hypothetical protein